MIPGKRKREEKDGITETEQKKKKNDIELGKNTVGVGVTERYPATSQICK